MKSRIVRAIICISAFTAFNVPTVFAADNIVASSGKMSDQDFYRAAACEASPGGECKFKFRKWPTAKKRNLTVAIQFVSPEFSENKRKAVHKAIFHATKEINGVGAGLNLTFVSGGDANIQVFLTDAPEGKTVTGTGDSDVDVWKWGPANVGKSEFNYFASSGEISVAKIAVSEDIDRSDIRPIVLKSIVASLGLDSAIENSHYNRQSVFLNDTHRVTKLRGQDAMVLLTHYPK
jgi:hypothetical protein